MKFWLVNKTNEYILPIVATLRGNDYFDSSEVIIASPADKTDTLHCGKCGIQRLILWMNEALGNSDEEASVETFSKGMSTKKKKQFQASVDLYTSIQSNETREGDGHELSDEVQETIYTRAGCKMRADTSGMELSPREPDRHELSDEVQEIIYTRACRKMKGDTSGMKLPPWFVEKLINCDMDCSFLLNIAVHHRIMFKTQVENLEKVFSFECSKHIRRVVYGLLMGIERKAEVTVTEYEKSRKRVIYSNVEAISSLPGFPELSEFPNLPVGKTLKDLFLAAFGNRALSCTQETDGKEDKIAERMIILMLSVWKNNSGATKDQLIVFIICILAMREDREDGKKDVKTRVEEYFNGANHAAISKPSEFCNIKKYLHKNAQLQAIFLHTYFLNQLLDHPGCIPNAENIFNGTLVYKICALYEDKIQPEDILGGTKSKLYRMFEKWEKEVEILSEDCARSKWAVANDPQMTDDDDLEETPTGNESASTTHDYYDDNPWRILEDLDIDADN